MTLGKCPNPEVSLPRAFSGAVHWETEIMFLLFCARPNMLEFTLTLRTCLRPMTMKVDELIFEPLTGSMAYELYS